MKMQKLRTSSWKSFLSVLVLGVFIVVALGSLGIFEIPEIQTTYLGDGVYRQTTFYDWDPDGHERTQTYIGKKDKEGRWHGPVEIVTKLPYSKKNEEVEMVNGKRHGRSKYTSTYYRPPAPPEEVVFYLCFNMGHVVKCGKSTFINSIDSTAFKILRYKYPWFLYAFNAFGFEDEYIESYMDTLEMLLGNYEFEDKEFYDYYDEVVSELEETVYDSIISLYSLYSSFLGLEGLKNDELRLAVFDAYSLEGKSTYDVIYTTYPGYLQIYKDAGIADQDFEQFCQDLDSVLLSYGPLDIEDPFFVDSLDTRLFGALYSMMDTEEVVSSTTQLKKGTLSISSSEEVVEAALFMMIMRFYEADIVKQSVREDYLIGQGVISVPTVSTEFSSNNSATSVTVGGYIIENGGASVTSSGIAWAPYYNPTTGDQIETSGKVSGPFSVTLNGLTEDATYYARSYATNSAGTAYGNCISFTGGGTVGVEETSASETDLKIYPNPTSGIATLSFQMESSKSMVLHLVDLKGQLVNYRDLGILPQGENVVQLDLSSLHGGIYHLQLSNQETTIATRKLLIVH